ncbi:hypothetical protein EVA_13395 [gut metagenome]|uniref:Uncharacterized protein n=1 Tax=gut metagenome TaxID=749906 RepID=J9FVF2_9ZZZZ
MNTGALNKLHDTGNKHVASIAYGINLKLFALDVFINQNRLILVDCNCGFKVGLESFLICNNLHCSAAQNVGGTDKNRVANFFCGLDTVFYVGDGTTLRLRNSKLFHDFFKGVSVLCSLNSCNVSAYNLNTTLHKGLSKVDSSLTAQRGDNADRIFHFHNAHNVLSGERLEVQLVGSGVVGGNGFGVVVYDNGLVAELFNSGNSVDSGVVKLNALTYTDRTGTENHNLFSVAYAGLVDAVVV